jgi:hypothetical protein
MTNIRVKDFKIGKIYKLISDGGLDVYILFDSGGHKEYILYSNDIVLCIQLDRTLVGADHYHWFCQVLFKDMIARFTSCEDIHKREVWEEL